MCRSTEPRLGATTDCGLDIDCCARAHWHHRLRAVVDLLCQSLLAQQELLVALSEMARDIRPKL